MKQHCCCTWQGHLWLAISTVVAAENRPKDDVVSCRVCFVSGDIVGEFVDPNVMKDREAVVSRWVCGFMLGLERILWCFSCCFVSGLCLWCLAHWNSLLWKRQNTTSFSAFSAMAWTEQNTLFHVGLGFCVGFTGAQLLPFLIDRSVLCIISAEYWQCKYLMYCIFDCSEASQLRQTTKAPCGNQKYPQYCWEFHDQLWEALSGTSSEKRGTPSRTGGETILEMLWKPQMPWIVGFGGSQPYSQRKFQEKLWEHFRCLSGIFPEFLPESPSRIGGVA